MFGGSKRKQSKFKFPTEYQEVAELREWWTNRTGYRYPTPKEVEDGWYAADNDPTGASAPAEPEVSEDTVFDWNQPRGGYNREAFVERSRARREHLDSLHIPFPRMYLVGFGLLIVLLVVLYVTSPSGGNKLREQNVPPTPAAATAAVVTPKPIPTSKPSPTPDEGKAFENIGGEPGAMENKVTMPCGDNSLTFSIMLRRQQPNNRLEVTLVTDRKVALDALWPDTDPDAVTKIKHINAGTVLASGTTCGVAITWDGRQAMYKTVGP